MRHFIAIAVLSAGGFAFAAVSAETVPEDIDFGEDVSVEDVAIVEVEDTAAYRLPSIDENGDLAELTINSTATHLDVAGVERTAAGRPVDAPPGSMDAAQTGMQHDARGIVTNTVSPEPTPSAQVERALAADPDLQEDAAEEENDDKE